MAEVSEKSKKSDILNAYQNVLNKLKEVQRAKPIEEQKKKEESKVVDKASKLSNQGIITGIAEIKLEIASSLDRLEGAMSKEFRKYNDLLLAIEIAEKKLDDLYGITHEAETLQALIESQEESTREFDEEMLEKREIWEREKEEKLQERTREEEEYSYQLKQGRQRDTDVYERQKAELEAELEAKRLDVEKGLITREENIAEQEEEFLMLKQKVENFPKELEDSLQALKEETEQKVKKELHFEMELERREMAGGKRLFEQEIETLKAKIEEQNQQILRLTKESRDASLQVQEIAMKAVEGASYSKSFEGMEASRKHLVTNS